MILAMFGETLAKIYTLRARRAYHPNDSLSGLQTADPALLTRTLERHVRHCCLEWIVTS
jgi:hypothetical protein